MDLPEIHRFDETSKVIDGKLWVNGAGACPAFAMFVGERPYFQSHRPAAPFGGPARSLLESRVSNSGIRFESCYWTTAVKYDIPNNKNITARDIKTCGTFLREEIARVTPAVICCLGSKAIEALLGRGSNVSAYRGSFMPCPGFPNTWVYGMYGLPYVMRNPEALPSMDRDLQNIARFQQDGFISKDVIAPEILQDIRSVSGFVDRILALPSPLLFIDMEWHGRTWMDPNRYIRTIQIGYDDKKVGIIEMRAENGVNVMDDEPGAFREVKRLLEDPRVSIGGHNVISDGEWLLSYGIDIRPRVVWDTMLAHYLLNETGPFGLEELSMAHTDYGRYDVPLAAFVKAHKDECRHGYGPVPRDLLLGYGALDVEVPRIAMKAQWPLIARDFMAPRGPDGQYPSLFQTTMTTSRLIYELEITGLLIDRERLEGLIRVYQDMKSQLLGLLTTEIATMGIENFNPSSPFDVSRLLFQHLKLTPIQTTGGQAWGDQVGNQGIDDDVEFTPSTDQATLEILEDAHPVVKHILQFRRIEQACKTWLRWPKPDEDETTKGGGMIAKIWPDGRLHAHFSQLAETGRFRHSKPNVANWPKKSDGYLADIFGGKDKVPYPLRTIVIPPPDHVIMEADFVQAELFVLAGLSGDQGMMKALTTPGKDLHDGTAISSFNLRVIDPDGKDVPEDFLIAMARKDKKEFEAFQKKLRYVEQSGNVTSRSEFKDTVRVGAKAVSFGIAYGRGATAISRQVKAETGTSKTLQELASQMTQIIDSWKTRTYPTAWAYLQSCARAVHSPGYIVNPWGRIRRFPKIPHDTEKRSDLERQGMNFPIQSTVADTVMIAMDLMDRYRTKTGLQFRFINQVHDAVQIYIHRDLVDAGKQMFRETMGSIVIPVGPPFMALQLGVDIDVMTRWGEKVK